MKDLLTLLFTLFLITIQTEGLNNEALEEVFEWKELEFAWPNEQAKSDAIASGAYQPEHNLPLGIARWEDKLFVTVPRWKSGVASSLNYIPLPASGKTASLIPYPDWQANTLPKNGSQIKQSDIVSTFRVQVDKCDRLWVMDTGVSDVWGASDRIAPPAIVIYNLKTNQLVQRYSLKATDALPNSFFANIVVDSEPADCAKAFAYLPDLGGYGLVVFDLAANDSWRVHHNFFHFDPLKGDFNIGGVNFQWTDGVFGMALGPVEDNGSRSLYFHALASTREFSVSTEILRNKTAATDSGNYYKFKLVGNRGDLAQASASQMDEVSNVMLWTQLNKDAIGCWNLRKPLNANNFELVAQDKQRLIFTNDIKIDQERNLWVLSDRMPEFLYRGLNSSQVNYRIFKAKIDDLIKNTTCA